MWEDSVPLNTLKFYSFSFDSEVKLDYFGGAGNWPRRGNQLPYRQGRKCKSTSGFFSLLLS